MKDMMHTRRDSEWLVKGVVPSDYITGPFTRRETPLMARFEELLGKDFDGEPTTDIDDVIDSASEAPRHRQRVPGSLTS
ncbi:hypothetical protein [Streptomyces sp. NPDC005795]|uniref:hypothetical protein n=1 Tax=Streptomyces sp. NPDC005795 TaxID=3154677 RepID=UPI0033C4AC8F